MPHLWWLLLGLAAGAIAMIPLTRLLLRRAEQRARRAERRARDAERLAELGSMTGGLAHEIKNPLSTIGLNAQLLAESIGESDLPHEQRERLIRRLDTLSREIERLRSILTDFLQFAGRMKLDPQPRDLGRLVEELSDFFHPQAAQHGIVMRTQLPREPVMAKVDEGLMKQAILNLMLNATQAMSASGQRSAVGGQRAGAADDEPRLNAESRRQNAELILRVEGGRGQGGRGQAGGDDGEACIHVIDTGPGIEPSKLNDIFRPYFTTRPGGTGLGLPTTRRIVHEHGGELTVHSEPGKGTDFTIHLPTV
jgi:signal transduction histidine kinase